MKYSIIGSETQVAATEAKCSLNIARRLFKPAKFSNGHKALVVATVATRRDANLWLSRSQSALAFISGRLGRWLTPTFVIVATRAVAEQPVQTAYQSFAGRAETMK